ncbi:phage virion morphogenesis protein [Candidatus Desantisbacteria bacterium]|nr:phage virion morphogenesis protein [Candidatus Desantisbacteria bacterium]
MADLAEIIIDNTAVIKLLTTLSGRLNDMSPIMRKTAGVMHDAVEENFAQEGRPEKWAPLAKSTIAARERKGYWPGKIMQRTGAMISALFTKYSSNAAIAGFPPSIKQATRMHWGYPGGTGRGHAETPARPVLVLPPETIEDIRDMLEKEITRVV